MEVEYVVITDRMDAMSVENVTIVNVCILTVNYYDQADVYVRTEQMQEPNSSAQDISL